MATIDILRNLALGTQGTSCSSRNGDCTRTDGGLDLAVEDKGPPTRWVALLAPWEQRLYQDFQVVPWVTSPGPPRVHVTWAGDHRELPQC